MVLLWHFREEKRILWDHRDALYVSLYTVHCLCVPSEWNINIQRWTVKKYIYLIIVHFLSICASLHLKDKYHTFHSTTFYQGPRSRKSFPWSFASLWVIFSSLKMWLFRQCISDHLCRALWSDFTAFFEHWPDADVIFICNNSMTRS